MKPVRQITCLFVDIGGVLLTNGWDHLARKRAAKHFGLAWNDMDTRHRLNFAVYEQGRLSLKDYLNRVVFYEKRSFTRAQFWRFMTAQSKPYLAMLSLVRTIKAKHGLKIFVVSNEGRDLNAHRIRTFKLVGFVDAFISSCFVHVRKPDVEIFRLALELAQTPIRKILYIENTPMFVQIAQGLGIQSILHTNFEDTRAKLASFGIKA